MCFSAGASFGAGVVLSVIGIASLKKVKSPSQLMFAGIPLVFAVQQITEGFLWLAFSNPAYAALRDVATYNFLFFAQVIWPVWIPLAIFLLEPKEQRRTLSYVAVGVGVLVSLYLAYCILNYNVEANIVGRHISYTQNYPPAIRHYCDMLYGVATIVPSFFSRIRRMWLLGFTILISYVITAFLYAGYIVSVWCFFASVISVAVYIILLELNPARKSSLSVEEM